MIEINSKNFKELFPKVESALKHATFISIDCEFSGIKDYNVADLSLFDTMPQRYSKLRSNIEPFIAIQIGITTFKYVRDANKYDAEPFSFYLLPKPLSFQDRQFSWQASAWEFLAHHNFQFDKLFYDGISYLDEQGEIKLRQSLKDNNLNDSCIIFDSFDDEAKFSNSINQVSKWLNNPTVSKNGSIEIDCDSLIQKCYLQKELRTHFKTIWTEVNDKGIIVIKVSAETREALMEKQEASLETDIIDYYLGFTKVFKLMMSLKKPIVGHNVLLDLLFMYKQFYRPLPRKYSDFKTEIHRVFPMIYDTKFVSYRLKRALNRDVLKSNILSELYQFFVRGAGHPYCIQSPVIELEDKFETEMYHDAGWDAYCCGYCFIKCAYVLAVSKRTNPNPAAVIELTNSEILYGVQEHLNCVNVISGDLSYLKLDGDDPSSTRPPWLNIRSQKSTPIDIIKVTESLSAFTPVAIKPLSKMSVLVATANYRTANQILQHFQKNKDYRVALYNPLKQSLLNKSLFWGGLVLSGGLLTWFFRDTLVKSSAN